MRLHIPFTAALLCVFVAAVTTARTGRDAVPQQGQSDRPHRGEANGQPPAAVGKITAVEGGALKIATIDGNTITIKLTDKTEIRKDRNPAKLTDLKAGDFVLVRGSQDSSGNIAADLIAARGGGQGGFEPGMRRGPSGTLGKDFVIGEVKAIDAPKLTVTRPDGVRQTLELNEDTTIRRGRESITMSDIQPGDHVVAHGALQGDVFVPKGLMVIEPEQWKRMQEMGMLGPGKRNPARPDASGSQPKPPESPN